MRPALANGLRYGAYTLGIVTLCGAWGLFGLLVMSHVIPQSCGQETAWEQAHPPRPGGNWFYEDGP
jgi:hypothetical protein